ncbi:B-cell differentiation antigen CD72-like [Spea bombifrons]|uniref:B-cell differentiation antigen CD72-like n=1 Tax=Spea bombifrons TaxID=233779 RepID=UPI00234B62E2|nr:B-cell differentiation antigen CD72-like [Spea bombifrons]
MARSLKPTRKLRVTTRTSPAKAPSFNVGNRWGSRLPDLGNGEADRSTDTMGWRGQSCPRLRSLVDEFSAASDRRNEWKITLRSKQDAVMNSASIFSEKHFYRSQRIIRCSVDLPDIKTRSDPQRTNRQQATRRPWALAIPLVLCLVFFISAIAVTVKFVQLTREYSEQNSSLSETIQNLLKEKALSRGESQKQLQALEEGLGSANRSLRQCHRAQEETAENVRGLRERLDEAQRDAAETQRELGDARSQLQALREGLCPTDWIFYNMKCYFISKARNSWYPSKSHCESLQSALVTVRQDDTNLQAFLAARQNITFWVGKEIYLKEDIFSPIVEWRWPAGYRIYKNQCGVFRDGQLAADECRESRPYICERSLVLLGLKPQDKNPQYKMSVNDVKFNCYQCAWC